jgi:hypothetical protein
MTVIRRVVAAVLGPPIRWVLRRLPPPDDPWERLEVRMALELYGSGVQYDFPRYLAGASSVSVASVEEVQEWLLGCEYQTDTEQFGRDHWQHPSEFEMRRVGDCDDFAVWAWRKLIELGIDATLVTGRRLPIRRPLSRHAWVTYRDQAGEYLFEAVARARSRMVVPLSEAKAGYRPEYGVDRTGRRFTYSGAMFSIREREGIDPLPAECLEATG